MPLRPARWREATRYRRGMPVLLRKEQHFTRVSNIVRDGAIGDLPAASLATTRARDGPNLGRPMRSRHSATSYVWAQLAPICYI